MPAILTDSLQEAGDHARAERYTFSIIQSVQALEAMTAEWNALLEKADIQHFQLRHEWFSTWLKYFPAKKLRIIAIRSQHDELISLLPLQIVKRKNGLCQRLLRYLQVIGTELSIYDWVTIPIAPSANRDAVLDCVAQALRQISSEWDMLDFQCCLDHDIASTLLKRFSAYSSHRFIQPASIMPYLDLPSNRTTYDAERDKDKSTRKDAREIKRKQQKIEESVGAPLTLEFTTPSPETTQALHQFFRLHAQYWNSRGKKSLFAQHGMLSRFYQDLLNQSANTTYPKTPRMVFSILKAGQATLSYQLNFLQNNDLITYITTYNPAYAEYSPGILHMEMLIRDSIEKHRARFEFGRGEEPYKNIWARERHELWNVQLFKNHWAFWLWRSDEMLKTLLKQFRDRIKP